MLSHLNERPRRLRASVKMRDLTSEFSIHPKHLIQPYFLKEGKGDEEPIEHFTGIHRWPVDKVLQRVASDLDCGVNSFLLFGEVPLEAKDEKGSHLQSEQGAITQGLFELKKRFGKDVVLFSDVCLCPGTSHGHCGVIRNRAIENDASLVQIAEVAACHAQAGADFVAPSDMMDGRVGHIRHILDQRGFTNTGIMAYTAKYASSYYGPFREALNSAPAPELSSELATRETYQMDYRNRTEALRELRLDLAEGADIVMVKPALAYLDIISDFKQQSDRPVAAYSVSGEYEMVKLAAREGIADEQKLVLENLTAIRRAGADLVITYYASEAAAKGWLR